MTREEILRSMEYALESDKRTIKNPISEYGWLFDKIYKWKKSLEQEPCDDKRPYIKVFADLEPDDIAEKIYQICDEDKFPKVIESLKEYFDSETCEDTISRKAVLDYIDKMPSELTTDGRRMIRRRTLEEYISDTLPSVIPQQRVGKWLYDKTIENWRCSICNETPKTLGYVGTSDFMAEHFRFCNHCGIKMEVSENE